jgi:hypothetical protein
VREGERLGYRLHREKFGAHYLFVEFDWEVDEQFGTAIPLVAIDAQPPEDEDALLTWLTERQNEHAATIEEAWRTILPGYRR